MNHPHSSCRCGCCRSALAHSAHVPDLTRRQFLYAVGAFTAGGLAFGVLPRNTFALGASLGPVAPRPLVVQPVLTFSLPQRREATSWREWGGIQTEPAADAEKERITKELQQIAAKAEFPLQILPLAGVQTPNQASAVAAGKHDVLLVYAAGGSGRLLETMVSKDKWNLMFLRHDPGPVYLWYEIVHPRFLRKTVDGFDSTGLSAEDVVVDDPGELFWRFRALAGLKNALGKKIVAVGGPSGWGAGGQKAPQLARQLWKLDIPDYPYAQLGPRIRSALADSSLVERSRTAAVRYLGQSGVKLQTTREFVNNAFVLCEVFKQIMAEAQTDAITINSCMGTIMPMAQTTACLPLSLLNDEGYLAFCESDFVVIPAGILLHYISGKPVFLNDPTYPHEGVVTLAHCTAPRKMDGKHYAPARIMTHFESDYGAAPKVEMRIGQDVTNLIPDFESKKWVGFDGSISGNPFLDICRSQIDVRIHGGTTELLHEMRGFHWMTCYGKYLRETQYALSKIGVEFSNLSATKVA